MPEHVVDHGGDSFVDPHLPCVGLVGPGHEGGSIFCYAPLERCPLCIDVKLIFFY
jgi:hypothetical protein